MPPLFIGAEAKDIGFIERPVLLEKQIVLFDDLLLQVPHLAEGGPLPELHPLLPLVCRSGYHLVAVCAKRIKACFESRYPEYLPLFRCPLAGFGQGKGQVAGIDRELYGPAILTGIQQLSRSRCRCFVFAGMDAYQVFAGS